MRLKKGTYFTPLPLVKRSQNIKEMRKKTQKEKKVKVGDRVWLQIPHNGTVDFVYRDGSVRVELDEIVGQTIMGKFGPEEIEIINE